MTDWDDVAGKPYGDWSSTTKKKVKIPEDTSWLSTYYHLHEKGKVCETCHYHNCDCCGFELRCNEPDHKILSPSERNGNGVLTLPSRSFNAICIVCREKYIIGKYAHIVLNCLGCGWRWYADLKAYEKAQSLGTHREDFSYCVHCDKKALKAHALEKKKIYYGDLLEVLYRCMCSAHRQTRFYVMKGEVVDTERFKQPLPPPTTLHGTFGENEPLTVRPTTRRPMDPPPRRMVPTPDPNIWGTQPLTPTVQQWIAEVDAAERQALQGFTGNGPQ